MRVEVLANGKQRRHWSTDDRTRILAAMFAAGAKVSDVARKQGMAPSLIFGWQREAKAKELGEAAAPNFVPVQCVAPRPTTTHQKTLVEEPPRSVKSMAKKTGLIEIDRMHPVGTVWTTRMRMAIVST